MYWLWFIVGVVVGILLAILFGSLTVGAAGF
jgi:uncharacterized membrane protein